jgi:hypothetical protein
MHAIYIFENYSKLSLQRDDTYLEEINTNRAD